MSLFGRLQRRDVAGGDLATPGEVPVMVPVQPSVPPVMMRGPLDPAGAGSHHGRSSGSSVARQSSTGTPGYEYVAQRYDAYQPALETPSQLFERSNGNIGRTETHHQGRHFVSYHIEPRRMWGVQPFFNGHHGRYRRNGDGIRFGTPSGGMQSHGGANPVVAREKPGAWDAGVVRGLPS